MSRRTWHVFVHRQQGTCLISVWIVYVNPENVLYFFLTLKGKNCFQLCFKITGEKKSPFFFTNQTCAVVKKGDKYWTCHISEHNNNPSYEDEHWFEKLVENRDVQTSSPAQSTEKRTNSVCLMLPVVVVASKQQLKTSNWEIKDGLSRVWEGLKPVVVCTCVLCVYATQPTKQSSSGQTFAWNHKAESR